MKPVFTQPNPTHTPVPYSSPCSISKKPVFFRSHYRTFHPKPHFFIKFLKKLYRCICVFHKPTIPLIPLIMLLSISVRFEMDRSCLLSKNVKPYIFSVKKKKKKKTPSFYPTIILLTIVMIKKKERD